MRSEHPIAGTLSLALTTLLAVSQAVGQGMRDQKMEYGAAAQAPEDMAIVASVDERPPTPEQLKFFEEEIRPILITHCYGCHSKTASLAKGGLRLDTRDATRRGGRSGPAVVPGDADSSLLVRAVRWDDPDRQMPPDEKISDDEIRALERWVSMGAPDPRDEKIAAGSATEASPGTAHRWTKDDIAQARQTHWAYKPVARPAVPTVTDPEWGTSSIDALLLADLVEHGLTPAPRADKRTLLRRASFDLTGLPPTTAEIDAFEADASPAAFAKAVDRMLASPAFGERWGRHWLDVARFAESSGKESNVYYPHAWRYRDYVIASFNEDKPFDRFLTEQLAGDLLPSSSDADRAEHLVATGYLAIGTKSHNARGRPQFQMDLADEQLDATTQGMLGLTVACARCHDHKFDPITQRDYYALAGIFLSTDTRYGTFSSLGNNHPSQLVDLPAECGLPLGPSMRADQRATVSAAIGRARSEAEKASETIAKAREARQKGQDVPADLQQQLVRARATQGAQQNLESLSLRFDPEGKPTQQNLVAMGALDRERPLNARVLDRGELDKPGELVHRGFVELLSSGSEQKITSGSGRLELAKWIARDDNPLTARVWANRVWMHLFGQGIVPTPDNFGMSGMRPTNPELLDQLATSLIASGWSTKKLIREIVLSRAYAMSSAFDAKNSDIDPDAQRFWRMPKKRLEGEAIRDSMLASAGVLMQKPRVGSPVAFAEGAARGPAQERIVGPLDGAGDNYRSVYLPIVRDKVPESLDAFDFAEPSFVTGQRDATNVPTQALFLMNSAEIARIADAFANRVIAAGPKDHDRIHAAFAIAFGRPPTSSEETACKRFLEEFRDAASEDGVPLPRGQGQPERPSARDLAAGKRESQRLQLRERARERLEALRDPKPPPSRPLTGDQIVWSALCQALFLSGEFRTLD